jgi:Zn-dependent peptidase ImmA (M78 family)
MNFFRRPPKTTDALTGSAKQVRNLDEVHRDDGTEHTPYERIPDVSPFYELADSDPERFRELETEVQQQGYLLAETVRKKYANNAASIIDSIDIANKMGLKVISRRLNAHSVDNADEEWISGILKKVSGDDFATIYVESEDSEERHHFTTAHEIWHWKDHTDNHTPEEIRDMEFWCVRKPEGIITLPEYKGDMFAHMLLLPRYVILHDLANGFSLQAIAKKSQVSLRTMENRLRQLAFTGI